MRRRDILAGVGGALFASPSGGAESTRLPTALPEGTKKIARFVNLPSKQRLLRLSDSPPNYETPVDVFTNEVTPNDRFFVRYHLASVPSADDFYGWTLQIAGDAVTHPLRLTMSDLLDLPSNQVLSVCQCAGNRRGMSLPHVPGLQWGDGAMGCAMWRGPSLREVLKRCGVAGDAIEVWLRGADKPSMNGIPPFQKSISMEKAMDADTIVAIAMNDAPLPLLNGYPARLVVPGWVGTYWMKHLTTIEVSTKPLANFWMGNADRVPLGLFPVSHPFASQQTETTAPITELVVNSLIADPLEGHEVDRSGFNIRGVAWDHGAGIDRVEVSLDDGSSWQDALLDRPLGAYAYRRFSLETGMLRPGMYKLMSRATSLSGEKQVTRLKQNAGGYQNNLPQSISVAVV